MNNIKTLFCLFLFALLIAPSYSTIDRTTTTIVVIDGKALLVDLNENGEIISTYMEVPEYFSSEKDHSAKVIDAKKTYTRLTEAQLDQIRFIALADEGWDLDEFMINNISDLANHYHQTYANQIEITAARNSKNAAILSTNVERIKELLVTYDVNPDDITLNYKIDLGDEPTRFIKVSSNLKTLSSF